MVTGVWVGKEVDSGKRGVTGLSSLQPSVSRALRVLLPLHRRISARSNAAEQQGDVAPSPGPIACGSPDSGPHAALTRNPASVVGRKKTEWAFVFQICDIAINWAGGLHHAKKFEVRLQWGRLATIVTGGQNDSVGGEELFPCL